MNKHDVLPLLNGSTNGHHPNNNGHHHDSTTTTVPKTAAGGRRWMRVFVFVGACFVFLYVLNMGGHSPLSVQMKFEIKHAAKDDLEQKPMVVAGGHVINQKTIKLEEKEDEDERQGDGEEDEPTADGAEEAEGGGGGGDNEGGEEEGGDNEGEAEIVVETATAPEPQADVAATATETSTTSGGGKKKGKRRKGKKHAAATTTTTSSAEAETNAESVAEAMAEKLSATDAIPPGMVREVRIEGRKNIKKISFRPINWSSNNLGPRILPQKTRAELLVPHDLAAAERIPVDYHKQDLSTIAGMKSQFKRGREAHLAYLREGYGDYVEKLFFPGGRSIGKNRIYMSPTAQDTKANDPTQYNGWKWFVQKMKIKILQIQLTWLKETKPNTTMGRYVHVCGGHSAAASHGNFYRESYCAAMERALKPVLKEIGINVVAKNYAMGGTASNGEIALCSTSLFGKDLDSVSWDYGMLDGKTQAWQYLFGIRNSIRSQFPAYSSDPRDIPSRPAVFGNQVNFRSNAAFSQLEKRGLTTLTYSFTWRKLVFDMIPDTQGPGGETLPPLLKYMKCSVTPGGKGPCGRHKYNTTFCPARTYQANWHPGFKEQIMDGNLMAFGIIEAFEEALDELEKLEPKKKEKPNDKAARLQKLFDEYNAEEQARYDAVLKAGLPGGKNMGWPGGKFREVVPMLEEATRISFCHIARLPAEIRFRGLLTENFNLTTISSNIERRLDDGYYEDDVLAKEARGIPFVNDDPKRKDDFVLVHVSQEYCPEEPTYLDRKDAFFLSSLHGWRSVILPNDSEAQFYNEFDATKARGWVQICPAGCKWGKCEQGDIHDAIRKGKNRDVYGTLEMEVNGIQVAGYEPTGNGDCVLLRRADVGEEDPNRYEFPHKDGRYHIRARIKKGPQYGYARISAFIFM